MNNLAQAVLLAAFEDELEKIAGLPSAVKKRWTARASDGQLTRLTERRSLVTSPDGTVVRRSERPSRRVEKMVRKNVGGRFIAKQIAEARKKGGLLGRIEEWNLRRQARNPQSALRRWATTEAGDGTALRHGAFGSRKIVDAGPE